VAKPARQLKNDRLYLRVSPRQREVINEAAETAHKPLTAFVLDAALADAERVLADRRFFRLDSERWDLFARALDRPLTPLSDKPRLGKLLEEPSILER